MKWQQLVGWQLVAFGAVWAIVVYGWGGASWDVLANVPHVVETVMTQSDLVRAAHVAAYGPGLLAVVIGAASLLDARRPKRTLAQQMAGDRRSTRRGK